MTSAASFLLFSTALLTADPSFTNNSYQTALREAEAKNRPLMVLVGADWCPGCRTMKQVVLPSLARRGALGGVSIAVVDTDGSSATARQLMRGGAIPQLIVFSRTDSGWKREQLTGAASEASVQSLIARALATQSSQPASELTTEDGAIGN
jgi:thioredoxin-like negative regulator of GroEL